MFELASLWQQAASAVLQHALFPLFLTLSAYAVATWLYRKSGQSPFVHPLVLSVAMVIVALKGLGLSYTPYFQGTQFLHWLLGLSIVALAIPLYTELQHVGTRWRSTLAAIVVGSVVSVVTAMLLATWLGGSRELVLALSTKSVTTALATVLAGQVGAHVALSAAIVLVTGLLGAVMGPWLSARMLPDDEAGWGTALGTCAHAIGTARALQISETCGAFSALAMGVNGLLTALLLPWLLAWWGG